MNLRFLPTVLASLALVTAPAWTIAAPATPDHPATASMANPRDLAPRLEGFEPTPELRTVHFDLTAPGSEPPTQGSSIETLSG